MWMTQCGPSRLRLCNKKAGGNVVQRRIPRAHLTKGEISDPRLARTPVAQEELARNDGESSWEGRGEARFLWRASSRNGSFPSPKRVCFTAEEVRFDAFPIRDREHVSGARGLTLCEAGGAEGSRALDCIRPGAYCVSTAGADRHLEGRRGFARQQFEIRIHAASLIHQQQDPLSPI
jgi:hypothetical protein